MKAGFCGKAPTLAMASSSVASGFGFGACLKPMWLSEICRKVNPLAACAFASEIPSSDDLGTPPAIVHSTPSARPDHAFQRTAAVDVVLFVFRHLLLLCLHQSGVAKNRWGSDLFPVIGGKKDTCRIYHSFGVLESPRLCAGGAQRRSDVKYDTRAVFAASHQGRFRPNAGSGLRGL